MTVAGVFDDAVRRHDEALAARGLSVWVGSEPTFTDRHATFVRVGQRRGGR